MCDRNSDHPCGLQCAIRDHCQVPALCSNDQQMLSLVFHRSDTAFRNDLSWTIAVAILTCFAVLFANG